MRLPTYVATAIALVLCAMPMRALAQAPASSSPTASVPESASVLPRTVRLELAPPGLGASSELASIESQSRGATGLYIASALLFLGGSAAVLFGVAVAFSPPDPSHPGSDALTALTLWCIGGAMVIASLITLPFAIRSDVRAGRRRGEYESHTARMSAALTVAPIEDGAMVVIGGSF